MLFLFTFSFSAEGMQCNLVVSSWLIFGKQARFYFDNTWKWRLTASNSVAHMTGPLFSTEIPPGGKIDIFPAFVNERKIFPMFTAPVICYGSTIFGVFVAAFLIAALQVVSLSGVRRCRNYPTHRIIVLVSARHANDQHAKELKLVMANLRSF